MTDARSPDRRDGDGVDPGGDRELRAAAAGLALVSWHKDSGSRFACALARA